MDIQCHIETILTYTIKMTDAENDALQSWLTHHLNHDADNILTAKSREVARNLYNKLL